MTFIIALLIIDFLFIFFTLYFLDEERKLPRIERTKYSELKEVLLGFEDGQRVYALLCSEDRAVIAAKLLLFSKIGCNNSSGFSRSFGISKQDLDSYQNCIIVLANIDFDLALIFCDLISKEASYDYIRVNSELYRFQML